MSIFEIIKSDHKKIRAFLSKLDKTTEDQVAHRRSLFHDFKSFLTEHARSEEKSVYVPLKTKEKSRSLSFEGFEEHHVVDRLIRDLSTLNPSKETWTAKMTVVKELLQHHLEEEEEDMFKKMRQNFSKDELSTMSSEMNAQKKKY